MTPLDYFNSFIMAHRTYNDGNPTAWYEDTRTGDEFDSRREACVHAQQKAESFESQTEL